MLGIYYPDQFIKHHEDTERLVFRLALETHTKL